MTAHPLHAAAMYLGGAIMTLIGIGHAFLPAYGYPPFVLAQLDPALADHFYFLATYALGGFLAMLGLLSLWLAARAPTLDGLLTTAALAIWWWLRLGLEIHFPSAVAIFGIEHPSRIILPVVALAASAYSVALAAGIKVGNRQRASRTRQDSLQGRTS